MSSEGHLALAPTVDFLVDPVMFYASGLVEAHRLGRHRPLHLTTLIDRRTRRRWSQCATVPSESWFGRTQRFCGDDCCLACER